MAINEDDQSKTTTFVVKGVHASVNAAQLKTNSTVGSVYTFTATYHHVFNGQHVDYRKGVSYSLDPALKATLLALGAPMVAA